MGKWKYFIPVVGFVIAAIEYQKVNRAYWRAVKRSESAWPEFRATWPALENTERAFMVTIIFLGVAFISVSVVVSVLK